MRFAFVVSSGLGYKIDDLFYTESSFDEFEKALRVLKQYGFNGVELNLSFDDRHKLDRIKMAINDSGLRLAAVGTGLVYARERLSFTDINAEKRRKALAIVKHLIRFASGKCNIVIIGVVRGPSSRRDNSVHDHLREGLTQCDRIASENNVHIALEAINRYETKLLNTATDVVQIIEQEELTATGLLLDTFHMNIEEKSIDETVRNNVTRIVHFHIADSNRWSPGRGHLEIANLLRILEGSGYEGWVSAETLPKPSNLEAVTDTAKFLRTHRLMRA